MGEGKGTPADRGRHQWASPAYPWPPATHRIYAGWCRRAL